MAIAILSFSICNSWAQFPTIRCNIDDFYNTTCTFSELQLTRTDYRFTPEADDYDVREVRIIPPSRVPTIGPDICNAFVNLKVFRLEPGVAAEEFAADAFQGCQYVDELQMNEQRSIRGISRQLFAPMKWIQYINWTHSDLEELPQDAFADLEYMWQFTWRQGKLKTLPADLFSSFKKMTILDVESNELSDIDFEGIMARCPDLKYVYFDDNPIKCSRLAVIKQALKARPIYSSQARSPKPDREVKLVKDNEGYLCLAD